MTPQEITDSKHDRSKGNKNQRDKTKAELLVTLRNCVKDTTKRRYLELDLVSMCASRNILNFVEEDNVISIWLNTPKLIMQCF